MLFTAMGFCQKTFAGVPAAEYRADQILIQPKKNLASAKLPNFQTLHQIKVRKTFASMGGLQVVEVPQNETVESLVEKYQKSGLVEFAEPDYIVHATATPDDPKYLDGTLWGLNNTGQDGGLPDADVDAPEAWDVLNSASNIVVAVLDSGIRETHEDLADNMWVNPEDGTHGFNAFTGAHDPADDFGHGTLVAGVLGAVGNNGKGVVGVAWRVQMMDCKCLDNAGNGNDSTVIACLDFARTNGARVINTSFDSPINSAAVSNAMVTIRDAGIILVASCGNGNKFGPHINVDVMPEYPACYALDNILSVAYTSRQDDLGDFSYYGPTNVDLGAPGEEVCSTAFNADNAYLIPRTNFFLSGTSFAAPMVAGTCALMLAKYPDESYQQIIARILKATDPVPGLAGKCVTGGRLNVWKALSPSIDLTAIPGTNGGPFRLRVSTGANRLCIITASDDLQGKWIPLFTNTTDINGVFDFVDEDSTNAPQRFYQAVSEP